MTRGAFIVIEGLDRSGKTTQTELLAARLSTSGVSVARRKFPVGMIGAHKCGAIGQFQNAAGAWSARGADQ